MIVSCPNCSSKFRTADDGSEIAGPLKCAKCGLVFTAQPGAAPAPGQLGDAAGAPAQRTVSNPMGKEWDSKMSGAELPQASPSAVPDAVATASATLPAGFDPLAEVMTDRPAATDLSLGPIAKRDPFYEENPLVVTRPPADAADQRPQVQPQSTAPAATPDPFAAAKARTDKPDPFGQAASSAAHPQAQAQAQAPARTATPPPARNPAETTDPFANVSLLAPADAPLAGDGEQSGAPPIIEQAPRPAPAVQPAEIAPVRPAAKAAPARTVPKRAPRPSPSDESFPPPPRSDVIVEEEEPEGHLLWGLLVAFSATLLAASVFFALWQFDVLDIDPGFTVAVASASGAESPLCPPLGDDRQRSQAAADLATQAREQGAISVAVVHYRRALQLEPDADDLRDGLAECFEMLGDLSAAADLRGR